MKHLAINPDDDCIYPITWVAENIKTCKIDRNYRDNFEPVLGKAIFVKLPGGNSWSGYAANDEGWLYVCDVSGIKIEELPDIDIKTGILEVEKDVNDWLKKHGF